MAYVFGGLLNLPILEILFILTIILLIGMIIFFLQMRGMNEHMKILEETTLDIKKYEEQEMEQVRRFETDMKKLEAEEAELFVTKVIPTVSKLENYVAVELLKGKNPEEIKGAITKRGIRSELATQVVNSMTYYMDFFKKLPSKNVGAHIDTVDQMKVAKVQIKKQ